MAIGFCQNEFKIAVNGKPFATLKYKSNNQLNCLDGFRILGLNGTHVQVTTCDHYDLRDEDCNGFESYSRK